MVKKKKSILFVAMSSSIHLARWMALIDRSDWDIHLYPSIDLGVIHPDCQNITIYHSIYGRQVEQIDPSVKSKGVYIFSSFVATCIRYIIRHLWPNYRAWQLKRLIIKLKPDIVHSLEMQQAGYLTLATQKMMKKQFPPWIVTTWGSDIYYFGRLPEHRDKIKQLLSQCDFYHCECDRDVTLAKQFGFKNTVLPVLPDSGGFDIDKINPWRQKGLTSNRKIIIVKGYHNWAGRALNTIKALQKCGDLIKGYNVVIYSADQIVIDASVGLKRLGAKVQIVPKNTGHQQLLKLFGAARMAIGVGISDGISTMVLEAMAMGAFPIQSNTSCAGEWIKDGQTGILVPPESIGAIAAAIKTALTDDKLVNSATLLNYQVVKDRLDNKVLRRQMADLYQSVLKGKLK